MDAINQFAGAYSWLSNFAPVTIYTTDYIFPSVEHAYMAAKSADISWKRTCSTGGKTAGQIKKLSRHVPLIPNWDVLRDKFMREYIHQKFQQEPFRTLLLATGDAHIQEGNYWNDKYWGICLKTGMGENRLGKIIMEEREELRIVLNHEMNIED